MTRDRGQSWTAISGIGLPNVGIRAVSFDPSDTTNRTLYVGTLIGVYRTTDGGATWARAGTGLPDVVVAELYVALDGSLVRIGTRGRGIWELPTK